MERAVPINNLYPIPYRLALPQNATFRVSVMQTCMPLNVEHGTIDDSPGTADNLQTVAVTFAVQQLISVNRLVRINQSGKLARSTGSCPFRSGAALH